LGCPYLSLLKFLLNHRRFIHSREARAARTGHRSNPNPAPAGRWLSLDCATRNRQKIKPRSHAIAHRPDTVLLV
jgi:hypothetical protein